MSNEVLLDGSELEPPEPLVLALEATEQLKTGQYLRMLHRREPCMLFDNLDSSQFSYYQRAGTTSAVEVFIWCNDDDQAISAVQDITGEVFSKAL